MLRGEVIKRLRKESEMTQEKLAEKLNISTEAVSKWERGDSSPDIDNLTMLADIFGTSTDYLLGRSVERYADTVADFRKLAKSYEKKKDYRKALDIFKEAIKQYPDSYELKMDAASVVTSILSDKAQAYSNTPEDNKRFFKDTEEDFEEMLGILTPALEAYDDYNNLYRMLYQIGWYSPYNEHFKETFKKYIKKLPSFDDSREVLEFDVLQDVEKKHDLVRFLYDKLVDSLYYLLHFRVPGMNDNYKKDVYNHNEQDAFNMLYTLLYFMKGDYYAEKAEKIIDVWCGLLQIVLKDYSQRDVTLSILNDVLDFFVFIKEDKDIEYKSKIYNGELIWIPDVELENYIYICELFDAVATDEYKQDKEIVDICNKIRTIKDQ